MEGVSIAGVSLDVPRFFQEVSDDRRRLVVCAARLTAALVVIVAVVWLSFLCSSSQAAGDEGGCGQVSGSHSGAPVYLPECRVYELVTPPYKEGYRVITNSFSSDGNKVMINSYADLANSAGAGESILTGIAYLDEHAEAGWRLASLNPPMSEFVGQVPLAFEADDGESLWMQHTPSQPVSTSDLYIRTATGDFRLVGPLAQPGAPDEEASNVMNLDSARVDQPVAATSDYGHVVVVANSRRAYWPFDNTKENSSLYEYAGIGNKSPVLVGVTGRKESTELIGECGTTLGGGTFFGQNVSAYNALANEGEWIFFTVRPRGENGCSAPAPLSAEIYVRVHGSLKSGEPAETIAVSASKCATACGKSSGSNFEGASSEGRRAFFTSTQKLTDDAVDGTASGNAAEGLGCAATTPGSGGCNLYEADIEHEEAGPKLRADLKLIAGGEVLGVPGIAENGARVYFVARAAIAGTGQNVYGAVAQGNKQPNLYVYDTTDETVRFIATLDQATDELDWQRVFQRSAEVAGAGGRFLLFASAMPGVTPDDTSSKTQLYLYDAASGELVRVTKGENGYGHDGNDVVQGVDPESLQNVSARYGNKADFKATTNRLSIAEDGKAVFFETSGQLSPHAISAISGCTSVYEFHTAGRLAEGEVSLISDGVDTQLFAGESCGARFVRMDRNGDNVLFSTYDPLVSADVDGLQQDIYDARVGGGFQLDEVAPTCGSGECEAPVLRPPMLPAPGSVSAGGEAAGHTGPGVNTRFSPKRRAALTLALRRCKTKPRKRRLACERLARQRYARAAKVRPTRRAS